MANRDLCKTEQITQAESLALYNALIKEGEKFLSAQAIHDLLSENGINSNDARLQGVFNSSLEPNDDHNSILNKSDFAELLKRSDLLRRAFRKELVIPDFANFRKDIEEIFRKTKKNSGGEIDKSLPHPGSGEDVAYAVSICTVDGQLLQLGNHDLSFSIQSITKAVNYAIAREEVGGRSFMSMWGLNPGEKILM